MTEKPVRNEVYANAVRAGKRTYFFDVKETRKGEYFLCLTESKRKFDKEEGKFFFEKHKLFLYKEDFEKFTDALKEAIDFIKKHQEVEEYRSQGKPSDSGAKELSEGSSTPPSAEDSSFSRVNFEDLDGDDKAEPKGEE